MTWHKLSAWRGEHSPEAFHVEASTEHILLGVEDQEGDIAVVSLTPIEARFIAVKLNSAAKEVEGDG